MKSGAQERGALGVLDGPKTALKFQCVPWSAATEDCLSCLGYLQHIAGHVWCLAHAALKRTISDLKPDGPTASNPGGFCTQEPVLNQQ